MSKNHNEKMDMTRWRKVRLKVFDRDGWRCVDCGKSGRLECDHVKPLSAGGGNVRTSQPSFTLPHMTHREDTS